jgi:hypothetical protein
MAQSWFMFISVFIERFCLLIRFCSDIYKVLSANMASIFKVKDVKGQKYCVSASTLQELKDKGKY